jgi:hypothetical protein
MNNEPNEMDHVETITSFWAIDDTLSRIRAILKEIENMFDASRNDRE